MIINNKRNSLAPSSEFNMCHFFWYLPSYLSMNMCIMLFVHTQHVIIPTPNLLNLKSKKPSVYWLNSSVSQFQTPERNLRNGFSLGQLPLANICVGCLYVPQ